MNHRSTDPAYLKNEQYDGAKNLAARIRLHVDYGIKDVTLWSWFFELALNETPFHAAVLEVGSGRGDMWKENQHRIPEGWHITLTDFSERMLADNRAFLSNLAPRMSYRTVDVQNIPFEDAAFDIVFANMMLYHVPDRDRAISEFRRVLKPEGVLFAMTNGANHMKEIYQIARQVDEVIEWRSVFERTFSIQNGADQLGRHFESVSLEMYENDLFVTHPQPLIDYIASMISLNGQKLIQEYESEIRANLMRQIASERGILIRKETGTFIARGVWNEATSA